MQRWGKGRMVAAILALLAVSCVPDTRIADNSATETLAVPKPFFLPAPETIIPPPPKRMVGEILQSGIVIVVSKKSQQMYVFSRGNLWRTSKVSTGKPGHATPNGVYAILQKREEHYSNLYNNAPMPFMQRLTWDGIALHAGAVPGYPVSHGCVRLPDDFAKELYRVTGVTNTAVIIADQAMPNYHSALAVARATDRVVPIHPSLLRKY